MAKQRKTEKKLERRIAGYQIDQKQGQTYDIHKPGSQNHNK